MEPALAAASELTAWELFLRADPVVKAVMAILTFASLWSWAVAIDKWVQFSGLRSRGAAFERRFWGGAAMEELDRSPTERAPEAMARVFQAGVREWRSSRAPREGLSDAQAKLLQDRCDRVLQAAIQRELGRAARGLPVLATIGSAAPFIGLFGTVWGIMNAFQSIAASQQTNLAVVAPGIAEALFATALGLAAAIPAVVFYNKFAGDLDRFSDQLEGFADEFVARLSRRLEEQVA